MPHQTPAPSLKLSLLPCAALIALLSVNVYYFGDDASYGPNQVALLLSALLASVLGRVALGLNYRDIELRAIKSIVLAMEAIIILLIVGCIIGLWILSGIVPTMIYYGIKAINPTVFLLIACLICSLVSLAIGSSWSTMGTVGVALIGIGKALGFPEPLVAGAIISGAYLGDKMSPLSDTTNLAPAAAGSELFTHIRHMFYTTIPAYVIAVLAFAGIGLLYTPGDYDPAMILEIVSALESAFDIHWYLLLVPLLVIVLAARRMPAIPALVIGGLLGALAALLAQPQQCVAAAGDAFTFSAAYIRILDTAYNGFVMESGHPVVDSLLSRGGMANMFSTVSLIMMAMFFGGAMEATGMLPRIARAILSKVRGAASLIGATVSTCILFNIFAAEQYLAIVITGRMFRAAYEKLGLAPRNLSRALEDGATVTSVLVPWNTCGAFASSVLGVSTLAYLPFCFFNLASPVISVSTAAMRIGIVYEDKTPAPDA